MSTRDAWVNGALILMAICGFALVYIYLYFSEPKSGNYLRQ